MVMHHIVGLAAKAVPGTRVSLLYVQVITYIMNLSDRQTDTHACTHTHTHTHTHTGFNRQVFLI